MENTKEVTPAKEPVKVVTDPRICLSMPVYGKIDVPFVQCLMGMLSTTSIVQMWDFLPGDSLVNRARNNLADRFLAGFPGADADGNPVTVKHDWMLFLDTDLIFKPSDVQMLYDLGMKQGPGVYVGTYPIKQLKPKVVFNNMPGCVPDAEGLVEVREAGTGFMLIHRNVFEQMIEKCSEEIKYCVDMGDVPGPEQFKYDFFPVGVYFDPLLKRKRFLSEDWYFCQRWRALGGKIIMHTKISCGHIGNFVFPGNPQEIIETADYMKKGFAELERRKNQPLVVKVGPPAHFVAKPEPVAVAV